MEHSHLKLTIYWTKLGKEKRKSIIKRFNLPSYISVNGETPAVIAASDMEALHKAEQLGYIQIRKMEKYYDRGKEKGFGDKA